MRLLDVDERTEATFLRCLHDERPDDPRIASLRRAAYRNQLALGLRAKVVMTDAGEVAALCQYIPIEHSFLNGERLMAILCLWVHGYEHHLGNRQGQGMGRLMLEAIEDDARGSGLDGVAAWGMDFPYWNPVSFFEHMGYERVATSGMTVLAWKPFNAAAKPPGFVQQVKRPVGDPKKVSVRVFMNGWCTGMCEQCVAVREAVDGLDDVVDYLEIDVSDANVHREWGISSGIYIEGEEHRADEPPPTSDVLREDILRLWETKRGS
jgi:N-acetylglutamate synthase-like GNAT family acetyltransferase